MFTGIIKDRATVKSLEKTADGLVLHIKSGLQAEHFERGASIAVDGVCLTAEGYELGEGSQSGVFRATAVAETLAKTNLSYYKEGESINLEPPLTLADAVAGHMVLGHVDFVAEVLQVAPDFKIAVPAEFLRFMPKKGSVTVNGVSLTIADSSDVSAGADGWIKMAIIPETMRATNLGDLQEGWHVNVEVDMLARYLDRLLEVTPDA